MENIEMALRLGGSLMMDEDAASIVAQIKSLLKQLRTKGATDKEIDSHSLKKTNPAEHTLTPPACSCSLMRAT